MASFRLLGFFYHASLSHAIFLEVVDKMYYFNNGIISIRGHLMKVIEKGQVTIPAHIREKLNIMPETEADFIVENGRAFIVKSQDKQARKRFRKCRGVATTKMKTDEILALMKRRYVKSL